MDDRDVEPTTAAGCLSAAGLRAVADAPPGGAPPELAAHLAGCARCQRRVLGVDQLASRASAARRPSSPRRFALMLLALLLVLLALVWSTSLLRG